MYNKCMENHAKKQIKHLLLDEGVTGKELAFQLSQRLNKNFSPESLSHKLSRGSVLYNEMFIIADILGYDIKFVRRQTELDKM